MKPIGPYVFILCRNAANPKLLACKTQNGCRRVRLPGGRETELSLTTGAAPNLGKQLWEQGWRLLELGAEIARDPYGEDGLDEVIWREARLAERGHFVGKFCPVWATADEVVRGDWLHEDVLSEFMER